MSPVSSYYSFHFFLVYSLPSSLLFLSLLYNLLCNSYNKKEWRERWIEVTTTRFSLSSRKPESEALTFLPSLPLSFPCTCLRNLTTIFSSLSLSNLSVCSILSRRSFFSIVRLSHLFSPFLLTNTQHSQSSKQARKHPPSI